MDHEIAFADPGASGVINDLRTIVALMQQIRALGGGVGGVGTGFGAGTGVGRMGGNAGASPAFGVLPFSRGGGATWGGGGPLFPPLSGRPDVGRYGSPDFTGRARRVLGQRSWGFNEPRMTEGLINQGQPFNAAENLRRTLYPAQRWATTWGGVGSVTESAVVAKFLKSSGRYLPSARMLRKAVGPVAGVYAAIGAIKAIDAYPGFLKDMTTRNTDYDRQQNPLRVAYAGVPEAHRAALKDLQYSVSAGARKQESSNWTGFRLNRNDSYFPWNWKSEDPVNQKRVRGITEELYLRSKYFGYNAAYMEYVGVQSYGYGDAGWEKRVAVDSALAATGRIYKSPYPNYIYARAKAGG